MGYSPSTILRGYSWDLSLLKPSFKTYFSVMHTVMDCEETLPNSVRILSIVKVHDEKISLAIVASLLKTPNCSKFY